MKKVAMYQKIYNDLMEKIKNKEYRAGDMLPSEKELTEIYQVSRITPKKAMDMLAEQRYIIREPGRGSFVNQRIDRLLAQEEGIRREEISRREGRMLAVIFDSFSSDFGVELLRSIEQQCRKKRYGMLFRCTYGNVDEENRAISHALEMGAEGIILMCAQGEEYNTTVLRMGLSEFPLVLVDRQMKGISIPCVKTDNYSAAYELTNILVKKGHKKICFVSHAKMSTSTINERYKGFSECMMKYRDVKGISVKLEEYDPSPAKPEIEYGEAVYKEIEELLEQNQDCTAFFTVEYKMAVMLRKVMAEKGIEKEVASFDALAPVYDEDNHFLRIKQDERKMGKVAVNTLCDWINGREVEKNIDIPYTIIQ